MDLPYIVNCASVPFRNCSEKGENKTKNVLDFDAQLKIPDSPAKPHNYLIFWCHFRLTDACKADCSSSEPLEFLTQQIFLTRSISEDVHISVLAYFFWKYLDLYLMFADVFNTKLAVQHAKKHLWKWSNSLAKIYHFLYKRNIRVIIVICECVGNPLNTYLYMFVLFLFFRW